MKNKFRGKVTISFIIASLFILPAITRAEKQKIKVAAENASIRVKPDIESKIIGKLPVGSLLEAERKAGQWCEVKFLSKIDILISEYIHEMYVEALEEKIEEVPKKEIREVITEEIKVEEEKAIGFFLEGVASYFRPTDQSFKDIYGSGMYFGGEISIFLKKILIWADGQIGIWAGGHYFTKKGLTTFTKENTKIRIMPIYVGLKFQVPVARVRPYVGLGVGYFQYKEESPIGTVKKGNIGYIGQIGCIFKIVGPLCFDFKGSYSYCKVKPVNVEVNLGGLQGVIGIGIDF